MEHKCYARAYERRNCGYEELPAPAGAPVPSRTPGWRPSPLCPYARPVRTIVRWVVQRRKPVSTRESMTKRQSSAPMFHSLPAWASVSSMPGISMNSNRTRSTRVAKLMVRGGSNLQASQARHRERRVFGLFSPGGIRAHDDTLRRFVVMEYERYANVETGDTPSVNCPERSGIAGQDSCYPSHAAGRTLSEVTW